MKTCAALLASFLFLFSHAQTPQLALEDFKFQSIFGHRPPDEDHVYCLLGLGFLRAPSAKNSDSLIEAWITKHPRASVVPVSTMSETRVKRPGSKMTYCWLIDGTDTINNYMIRNGCYPGGTMAWPEHDEKLEKEMEKGDVKLPRSTIGHHVAEKDYEAFLAQIKIAEAHAEKNLLGIWGDPAFNPAPFLAKIDKELTQALKTMRDSNLRGHTDGHSEKFKAQLTRELKKTLTFRHTLDSLSSYMKIISSGDARVKFYGWDEWTGGTWHSISSLAQFRHKGEMIVQDLGPQEETRGIAYTDCSIYEVHDLQINGKTHYLTFAWGTHGAGMEHRMVRVFRIENDSLVNCQACFSSGSDLALEYPRAMKIDLKYDPKTQAITYKGFSISEERAPFADPTGKTITLELKDGKFSEKK